MPTNSPRVTLLAPGCFSAIAQAENGASEPGPPENGLAPDVNDSKAVATQTQAYEQALAVALQQPVLDMGALPIAQLQFPLTSVEAMPEHCVCAELIHLQADRDNARLIPEAALSISEDESAQLLDALNALIGPDGLNVHRNPTGQCYLTGMPAAALDTWPAHAVANGKIANFLPRRADAGDWRRLLTEVQMLFHAHPVNAARAELNQLPINAMWFWGGKRSDQFLPVTNLVLIADDAYACGLGAALNLNTRPLASSAWTVLVQDYLQNMTTDEFLINDLVIVDLCVYAAWLSGDQAAISAAKQLLHKQWIVPVQSAVADGLVSEFVLDGCEGQAIVERQAGPTRSILPGSSWLRKIVPQRFSPGWLLRAKDK